MMQYIYQLSRWRLHLCTIKKNRNMIKLKESEDTKSWKSKSPEDKRDKPGSSGGHRPTTTTTTIILSPQIRLFTPKNTFPNT